MPVHETTIQKTHKLIDLTELSDSDNDKMDSTVTPAAQAVYADSKPAPITQTGPSTSSHLPTLDIPSIKLEKPLSSTFKFNPFTPQIMTIRSHSNLQQHFVPRMDHSERFNIVFDQKLFALNTSADKALNGVRDCILQQDENKMARIAPYFWKIRKELHVQGDCLFRGSRLVVPQNLTRAILARAHEDHAGAAAMKDRCGHLWWPSMNHQIQILSSGCKTCSYTGKNLKFLKPRSELGTPETPTHSNQIVELDFWGPLRSSHKNKHYVLVGSPVTFPQKSSMPPPPTTS